MGKKFYARIPLTDVKCIEKNITRIQDKIHALNKKVNDNIGSKYNTGRSENTEVDTECPKTISYALKDIHYMLGDIELKIENIELNLKRDGLID